MDIFVDYYNLPDTDRRKGARYLSDRVVSALGSQPDGEALRAGAPAADSGAGPHGGGRFRVFECSAQADRQLVTASGSDEGRRLGGLTTAERDPSWGPRRRKTCSRARSARSAPEAPGWFVGETDTVPGRSWRA